MGKKIESVNIDARKARLEEEARSDSVEHIWIVTLGYRLSDENAERAASGGSVTTDHENLVGVAGPLCWRCQRPYNKYPCPAANAASGEPVEAEIVEDD